MAMSPFLLVFLSYAWGLAHGQDGVPRQRGDGLSITLTSPLEYQIFQRRTLLNGAIVVSGRASWAKTVEVQIEGDSISGPLSARWIHLSLNLRTHEFGEALPTVPGGFYTVAVRATGLHGETAITSIKNVGVGEVFVVSGQSNSTNYGEVQQKTKTGMVTSFDGLTWRLADDPQLGVQDKSKKGSFIPAFGDALYRRYHVPIGIASVGHGSTSVRQWLPKGVPIDNMPTMTRYIDRRSDGILVSDGTLFDGMMLRIHQLGLHGFRGLLWHQGESDSHQLPEHEIAATTYAAMMKTIIRASRRRAGWNFPWFVAQATYHTPDDRSCPPIRGAQRSLWQSGLAFEGPDTDMLTMAYRQNGGKGTHFNEAGLKAHGLLWAESVSRYLDTMLQPFHRLPDGNESNSP
jgi:hypothetical protein